MSSSKAPDAHLALVTDEKTGLYHGAVFRNAPTPSGADRYLLAVTTKEGHLSARDAILATNALFPDIEPLPLDKLPDDELPAGGYPIPRGAIVTRVIPRSKDAKEEAEGPGYLPVEVSLAMSLLDVRIPVAQFDRMVALGHLAEESTSGNDPDLHYRYDHYVLTEVGRRFHPVPPAGSVGPRSRAA